MKSKKIWNFVVENLPWVNSLSAYLLIKEYVIDVRVGSGKSMMPTFGDNELLLIDHISPRLFGYQRGDVILAINPSVSESLMSKRIIHMENDVFQHNGGLSGSTSTMPDFDNDEVFNPKKLIKIKNGFVWVQGDNTNESLDSRHLGPISEKLLIGRVLATIYPSFKIIDHGLPALD